MLTANELKSLMEKHRRELEQRKVEEEKRKNKIEEQINDFQKHGGISQNFVPQTYHSQQNSRTTRDGGGLPSNYLNENRGKAISSQVVSAQNNSIKNNKL